jgi:urease accessory protein
VDTDDTPGNYAVVLGIVTGLEGVSVHDACLLACHSFVTGLLGADSACFGWVTQTSSGCLTTFIQGMSAAVEDSADRTLDEMTPFAPLIEIRSAEHERADRRLFKS